MSLEIEVRFRLPNAAARDKIMLDPEIGRLAMRDFVSADMSAAYYDTPRHDLRDRRATLRRRFENGVPAVSFKCSEESGGGLLSRRKWECPADDVPLAIGTLLDMGAPEYLGELAGSQGFMARGRFDYTRRGVPLMLQNGTAVELDIDEGFVSVGEKREEMSEAVIKLLYGDPEILGAFASRFERDFQSAKELCSKYERALRLLRSRG